MLKKIDNLKTFLIIFLITINLFFLVLPFQNCSDKNFSAENSISNLNDNTEESIVEEYEAEAQDDAGYSSSRSVQSKFSRDVLYPQLVVMNEDNQNDPNEKLQVESSVACYLKWGKLKCWGRRFPGFNYIEPLRMEPTVYLESNVSSFSISDFNGCAIKNLSDIQNKVYCWGNDIAGLEVAPKTLTPIELGNAKVLKIVVGSVYACAITQNQDLYCWGRNAYGTFGVENLDSRVDTPIKITSEVTDVAIGEDTTCVIKKGDVWCWGLNVYGNIGVGTDDRYIKTPTKVLDLPKDVRSISVKDLQSCAATDTNVWCWGQSDGWPIKYNNSPQLIPLSKKVTQITKLESRCLLGKDELNKTILQCWTNKEGVFRYDDQDFNLNLDSDDEITNFSMGDNHKCISTMNKKIYCWGNNESGQLGNGMKKEGLFQFSKLFFYNKVTSISSNGKTNCASLSGEIRCWGWNNYGVAGTEILQIPIQSTNKLVFDRYSTTYKFYPKVIDNDGYEKANCIEAYSKSSKTKFRYICLSSLDINTLQENWLLGKKTTLTLADFLFFNGSKWAKRTGGALLILAPNEDKNPNNMIFTLKLKKEYKFSITN